MYFRLMIVNGRTLTGMDMATILMFSQTTLSSGRILMVTVTVTMPTISPKTALSGSTLTQMEWGITQTLSQRMEVRL